MTLLCIPPVEVVVVFKSMDNKKHILTINEVMQQPEGAVLDGVVGIIRLVGPVEHRFRPDGEPYCSQIFILADDTGAKIHGTIYDNISLADFLGKEIILASMKARNGRYGGITVQKSLYEGTSIFTKAKARNVLRVSKLGSVSLCPSN